MDRRDLLKVAGLLGLSGTAKSGFADEPEPTAQLPVFDEVQAELRSVRMPQLAMTLLVQSMWLQLRTTHRYFDYKCRFSFHNTGVVENALIAAVAAIRKKASEPFAGDVWRHEFYREFWMDLFRSQEKRQPELGTIPKEVLLGAKLDGRGGLIEELAFASAGQFAQIAENLILHSEMLESLSRLKNDDREQLLGLLEKADRASLDGQTRSDILHERERHSVAYREIVRNRLEHFDQLTKRTVEDPDPEVPTLDGP